MWKTTQGHTNVEEYPEPYKCKILLRAILMLKITQGHTNVKDYPEPYKYEKIT